MRVRTSRTIIILTWMLLLSACLGVDRNGQSTLSSRITLLPFATSSTAPMMTAQSTTASTPSPTTEPVVYSVVAGDSLSAIALRFGVNLDDLLAANPMVNPNAMSIGTRLVIPQKKSSDATDQSTIAGLPTPVVQSNIKPDCYRLEMDEWLCFLNVKNDLPVGIENITGQVVFNNESVSFPASCPLDMIPPGSALPLIAMINRTEMDPVQVSGLLLSASPVNENDQRYGVIELKHKTVDMAADRRSAVVSGEYFLPLGGKLRVIGYAVDMQGRILGYRVWDAAESLTAGVSQTITFNIYSLGGEIKEVHLVANARLK